MFQYAELKKKSGSSNFVYVYFTYKFVYVYFNFTSSKQASNTDKNYFE